MVLVSVGGVIGLVLLGVFVGWMWLLVFMIGIMVLLILMVILFGNVKVDFGILLVIVVVVGFVMMVGMVGMYVLIVDIYFFGV